MIRLFGLALAGLLALAQPLNAAGTVSGFALTPQFDGSQVMPGCKLYVIQAGTTQTPQNSYSDSALTIPQPNPLLCDQNGRLPMFYLADGQIKLRLTNAAGVQKFVGDNIPVIGPSSGGGGGGGSVDPTTILQTGNMVLHYGTGVRAGFVRQNGRTIGSATSGATERANADCQALFEYLWNADPNLSVSTGRGASANADWVANKTITLPDARNRALTALGGMGNSVSTLLNGVSWQFGNADTLGATAGAAFRTILTGNLPPYAPSGIITIVDPGHNHGFTALQFGGAATFQGGGASMSSQLSSTTTSGTGISAGFTGASQGGQSIPLETISPIFLMTVYLKL
jgi:hypothetical protein